MTFCDFLLVTHQQGCQIGAEKWAKWLKNCIKPGHFQLIYQYISAIQARIGPIRCQYHKPGDM